MRVTILGCGGSAGVPLIGCDCAVCCSSNPKNNRTRASILLQDADFALLVDAGPDIRQQSLRENIRHLDAVFFTHAHADHCHGIDELRSFNYLADKPLDCYSDRVTLAELKGRFGYVFLPPVPGWYRAALTPHELQMQNAPQQIGPWEVVVFRQQHGRVHSLGLRVGNFAYSTDVTDLDEAAFAALTGVDVWVVDCLRTEPAPTHAHLARTLEWIERVKPKRAILTHMSHEFEYESLAGALPAGVEPGYDGLVITL
jgi:phosphoribosyl 1,2-cyclic phosphate phosphodiesterase